MSWEESHRKEQIFRKKKTNREIILKTVEQEDGKITLSFSLRNNETSTELPLTIEEWKSILSFLKKTSEHILQEIEVKKIVPIAKPIAEPIVETNTESTLEPAVTEQNNIVPHEDIPVSPQTFSDLAEELDKVTSISEPAIPVIPSEQVITELRPSIEPSMPNEEPASSEPDLQVPIEESEAILGEESPASPESSTIEGEASELTPAISEESETIEKLEQEIAELIPIPSKQENPDSLSASENSDLKGSVISAPPKPKISQDNKVEIKSLLTPIHQPKLPLPNETEPVESPSEFPSSETSPSEELPEPASSDLPTKELLKPATYTVSEPISAEILLDEAHRLETEEMLGEVTHLLGDDSKTLNFDEKEARIISAMEEVANLMPPGPAKKFVEDMMLKRAAEIHPRVPQKNENN
ncbi:MAG: hypothetical protein ACTSQ8_07005 [Candidatus Helarchaeota archaeon]